MDCKLGFFVPSPLPPLEASMSLAPDQLAQLERGVRRPAPRSDLRSELPEWSEDHEWVEAVHDTLLAKLRAGVPVRVTHCELEPGVHVGISAVVPYVKGEVRTGDEVVGGFAAVRSGGGALRVLPRVVRLVCDNGAVVGAGWAADVRPAYGSVRDAVETCLGRAPVDELTRLARAAADVRVADPARWLGRLDPAVDAGAVRRRFDAEGPRTGWDLVNAITAEARFVRALPARLRVEQHAVRVLRAMTQGTQAAGRGLAETVAVRC